MRYCVRCVLPEIAVNVIFDDDGVCSACRVHEELHSVDEDFWAKRKESFDEIVANVKSESSDNQYDCVIPVSGGKDSYWQTHIVKNIYNMTPLLVTYHGNNYLPEGQANLDRMREVFDVDHIVFGPGVSTLKKLNKICFKRMGDMNWHAHAGIKILPLIIAVKFKIPLLIWGEITWSVSGMFSPSDYVEYNKRTVQEHDLRGFDWKDMVDCDETLSESELLWLKLPDDRDIAALDLRGLYIGNYFPWDPNKHARLMQKEYGFEFSREPFERTYRRMSNLDDMHENGVHDYMKYIKFGYGRATDHACKDIRDGYISRNEGIEMVRKYDHVKPRKDLKRWLEYVDMKESEFDEIADSFRNPRVWSKSSGNWVKDNLWDKSL